MKPWVNSVMAVVALLATAKCFGQAAPAEHITDDTIATVSLWPNLMSSREQLQLAPWEVVTAAGLEHVGIDPTKLERVDVAIGFPGAAGPQFAAIIKTSEPIAVESLNPKMFRGAEDTNNGFTFRRMAMPGDLVLGQIGSSGSEYVFGTSLFAARTSKSQSELSALGGLLTKVNSQQDALALVDIKTLRPLLEGILEGQSREIPPPVMADLQSVIGLTQQLALRVTCEGKTKVQLFAFAESGPEAEQINQHLQHALGFARSMALAAAKEQVPNDTPTGQAAQAYLDRISAFSANQIVPVVAGNRVVLEFEDQGNLATIGVLTGLLLPAVQAAREAARRMESSNNLKQFALGLHNYAAAYRSFPPQASSSDVGKPLLSWRVAILPFLGEHQALYERFHLDEPWDSEHNIQLLEEMPAIFESPRRFTQPGYTVFQAPVGEKTIFGGSEGCRFRDITDGTSNTILLVETAEEYAVPWTAPDDYQVDANDPLVGLAVPGEQVFQVCFADGSVHAIPVNVDLRVINALLTRNGGEDFRLP